MERLSDLSYGGRTSMGDTSPPDPRELLLTLYRENSEQARHYERQREVVTAVVASGAALVVGLVAPRAAAAPVLLAAALLVVLGAFGFAASLRHFERSRLHVQRVHVTRRELSRLYGVDIEQLYAVATRQHEQRFRRLSRRTARIHYVWQALHVAVIVLGLLLAGWTLSGPAR